MARPTASMTTQRQEALFHRKRKLLNFLHYTHKQYATLTLADKTRLNATVLAIDAEQTKVHTNNLDTYIGVYKYATLRTSDILYIEFDANKWIASPAQSQITATKYTPRPTTDNDSPQYIDETTSWNPQNAETKKYYVQRYNLFSRYDQGIRMDREGWFSVTPEKVAQRIASNCRSDLIVDAFTGVGGNAIQFAFTCQRVIAIDINKDRLAMARHNAAIYDVADRIEFVHGDFLALAPGLNADVVFLSPPWGGPAYADTAAFDMTSDMGGLDGEELLKVALQIAPNVGYYLPRNVDRRQLYGLAESVGINVRIEECRLRRKRMVAFMAYFGFDEDDV